MLLEEITYEIEVFLDELGALLHEMVDFGENIVDSCLLLTQISAAIFKRRQWWHLI